MATLQHLPGSFEGGSPLIWVTDMSKSENSTNGIAIHTAARNASRPFPRCRAGAGARSSPDTHTHQYTAQRHGSRRGRLPSL